MNKRSIEKIKPLLFLYRILLPFVDMNKFLASIVGLPSYIFNLFKYMWESKRWLINWDMYPILDEKVKVTGVDYHYLYQQIWVFNEVNKKKPKDHYDVSSTYQMSCYLAGIAKAHFVDLRPIEAEINNLEVLNGDIENLEFRDNSIESLSCLHVIEHIGLGRYGDNLNVNGPEVACKELTRVLKPGGYLYLSTPIGRERICYNAHHVFNPKTILKYFKDLKLESFNMVDDAGKLSKERNLDLVILSENLLEITDFKTGFCGVKPKHLEGKKFYSLNLASLFKLLAFYGKEYLFNPSYINKSLFDSIGAFGSYYVMPHKLLSLYSYIEWDEGTIEDILINQYGWEKAKDSNTTWRIGDGTAAFYNYIYYMLVGFSEIDTFRSNQIREGKMSREEAVTRAEKENMPRIESMLWYAQVVGFDLLNALKIIKSQTPLYEKESD